MALSWKRLYGVYLSPSRDAGIYLYKYRLFYGYPGQRLVGYGNERGKGDHRHMDNQEMLYPFTTPEKLIDDFLGDIDKLRSEW